MTSTNTNSAMNPQRIASRLNWRRLSLAKQFALAGSVVMFLGMIAIGLWVTDQIEDGVTRNSAASTSLYMTSFVEPLAQELVHQETLSLQRQAELDALREGTPLGKRIITFKIWKEGGMIAYSSRKEIIGKRFEPTASLTRAWQGEVSAEFDSLGDEEDVAERNANLPLLEIYSPIRETGTGRIIAVAEFYEIATALKSSLFWANLQSWLVVGAATLMMFGLLSGIVSRGSRTIDQQHDALERRVGDLSQLLAQNEQLRDRVQGASRRTAEINEQYLRRIGADLHDGPAQLLSLAALRLDALSPHLKASPADPSQGRTDIEVVRESLTESLSEIRNISVGLTLPKLNDLSTEKLLRNAANAHERRTNTTVEIDVQSAPDVLDKSLKICLYRFVQEALSNAFRHAGGSGQRVTCRLDGETLEVTVSDNGPGFDLSDKTEESQGLGLRGLRDRIDSLGGNLTVLTAPGQGTSLMLRCDTQA